MLVFWLWDSGSNFTLLGVSRTEETIPACGIVEKFLKSVSRVNHIALWVKLGRRNYSEATVTECPSVLASFKCWSHQIIRCLPETETEACLTELHCKPQPVSVEERQVCLNKYLSLGLASNPNRRHRLLKLHCGRFCYTERRLWP